MSSDAGFSFLRTHKDGIAAMDFFTVQNRLVARLVLLVRHPPPPTTDPSLGTPPSTRAPPLVIHQLREALRFDTAPRHLIFDRDSIFSREVVAFVKSMTTKPCRTSYRSPWQNPVAERWIGGCRRELFDHVVVRGESHAVRLAWAYIDYFHEDRTHLGLGKDTPSRRPVTLPPSPAAKVVPIPRLGGLHHRYEWREAA